ncbi:unnamed protein product [Anisakis simplex]|uniref:ADH_zinc_N domain-containing protein n=1 Tax=Anisakis simplex TaxID=6269 RepID=A0A0M3KIJ2_ANISI|nr:unnamed protein product [Anisakis simplex]
MLSVWGFRTVNLIRDRGEVNKKIRELTELGGDYVLTETEFMKNRKDVLKNLYEPVKLALNGVGGRSALVVASALERGGTVVSYGEMSGENAQFSTSSFIFNDIIARGFAIMNFYNNPENATKCDQIFHDLQELYKQNRLKSPDMDKWGMQDYSKAIEHAVDHGHPKQLIIEDTVL